MFRDSDRQKCQRLFDRYYQDRKFYDARYRELIARHLQPGQRLLDAGCGRYMKYCKDLSGTATVVGLDFERPETENRRSPYGVRGDLHCIPFRANSFDMVISRSVVEHLDDPARVFREWSRVLRPGGKVVIVTPNRYDYVSLIAAFTPHRLHQALVSRIFRVPEDDVFPTRYRANSMSAIRKAFRQAGLTEVELQMLNHYPAYLMFSPVLFRLGVVYERITAWHLFRGLRGSILCAFEKPAAAREQATDNNQAAISAAVRMPS
jgi:SAM-dependent methyltransferase